MLHSVALMGLQVAVSLTLVVTAGLLVQSFERLAATPLGFDRDRAIVVTVGSPTVPAGEKHSFTDSFTATTRSDVPST